MTRNLLHRLACGSAAILFTLLAACGGGGGGAPAAPQQNGTNVSAPSVAGANVLTVRMDRGTDGSAFNAPFVTVTVCQPGTATCLDIDHVIVDTGSNGLRLAASAVPGLSLPRVTNAGGTPVGECAKFASGFTWGGVRRADVRLGGLTASNLSVQVIADGALPAAPTGCSGSGTDFGAVTGIKGILGVGLLIQDCGLRCLTPSNGVYYACSANTCNSTALATALQVSNPVPALPSDNNGVVLVLPAVPAGGAASVTGSLILGIGTQANNQLGGATVLTTDADGLFSTVYKGTTYTRSFIDSGSNGLFFTDSAIPNCTSTADFYCPPASLQLSATQVSAAGVSKNVDFTVESINSLSANTAAANVGGRTCPVNNPNCPLTQSFDWGLPFFFGRSVFVAISGAATPAGPGPYWAY